MTTASGKKLKSLRPVILFTLLPLLLSLLFAWTLADAHDSRPNFVELCLKLTVEDEKAFEAVVEQDVRDWLRRQPARTRTRSAESDAMSGDLRRRGMKFVGSTICYAFMQAAGLVNDHLSHCHRFAPLGGKKGQQ